MTDSVLNELKKKVNKAVSIKKKITEYSKLLETLKDGETVMCYTASGVRGCKSLGNELSDDIREYAICTIETRIAKLKSEYESL